MEVSTSLLVAIMFVTILAMGIGGLLTSAADLTRKSAARSKLHIHWLLILLYTHLGLFWNTGAAISLEWRFLGFLFVILGPILLYTTTHVLLASIPDKDSPKSNVVIEDRVLHLFALVQAWMVCITFKLDGSLPPSAAFNAALLVSAVTMSFLRRPRQQEIATGFIWVLILLDQALLGLEIIR